MKQVAVRLDVNVLSDIRVWELPDKADDKKALEYAERELDDEFRGVGFRYNVTANIIPMDKLEAERENLIP
jgi:hypothetical protein